MKRRDPRVDTLLDEAQGLLAQARTGTDPIKACCAAYRAALLAREAADLVYPQALAASRRARG